MRPRTSPHLEVPASRPNEFHPICAPDRRSLALERSSLATIFCEMTGLEAAALRRGDDIGKKSLRIPRADGGGSNASSGCRARR